MKIWTIGKRIALGFAVVFSIIFVLGAVIHKRLGVTFAVTHHLTITASGSINFGHNAQDNPPG